ncbi:hypothetical protein MASR2M47_18470 [Draconibacterium sp.]|jgi:uncharacterized protein YoxC
MNKNMLLGMILIGSSVFLFSGCGSFSQKSEDKNAATTVISEELHQAQCDLLSKANENLAGINQKVRTLNDKIREKGVKFTDDQNKALDDFELKQASINKRMHEIKNINQEDWESFKTTFENDLEEINTLIDNIVNEL